MSSVIQKVNSQGVLGNSVELLKIADVATRELTVDQGLDSVSKLLGLARSLTGLPAKNVTLLTMPTVTDPANVNQLRQAGRAAASSGPAAQTTVQSRNAGASICSGLPAANPDPGTPGG